MRFWKGNVYIAITLLLQLLKMRLASIDINPDRGQRRWKILRTRRFWLEIIQLVSALVSIVLCVTFDQNGRVRMIHTHYFYDLSLVFPFVYEPNVTVKTSVPVPLKQFKFESLLSPSVLTFVAATSLALVVAIVFFTLNIIHHGTQKLHGYVKLNFFVSLAMTFMLLAGICLWLANLIALVHDVNYELDFLFHECEDNHGKCERQDPQFISLYISVAFGILFFIMWLIECISLFIRMVYTIPREITSTTLLSTVELHSVERQ